MTLYYCPLCGHFDMKRNNEPNPYTNEKTIQNMLDWSRFPIQHYKCECGNHLAGYFELKTPEEQEGKSDGDEAFRTFDELGDKQKEDNICFYQDMISMFNVGGHLYHQKAIGKTRTFENLDEFARWAYQENKKHDNN